MEDKTCRKYMVFRYTDLKAICEYLEEMSEKGWELVSLTKIMVEFKKIEPHRVRYSVELIDTASSYNDEISDETKEYIDMCEQAGWEFVCNRRKMFIFRTEDESIPDIVSDSYEKLQSIKNAIVKSFFAIWIIYLLGFFFDIYADVFMYKNIAEVAASNIKLGNATTALIFIIIILTEMFSFIIWYIKAKRALDDGKPISYINLKKLKRRKFIILIPIIMIIIFIPAIYGITDKSYGFVLTENIRVGAEYNSDGTLIMSDVNIPVSVIQLGAEWVDYNHSYGSSSLIASIRRYSSDSYADGLMIDYEIYYSKFDFLTDKYVEVLEEKSTSGLFATDASVWGAEMAYMDLEGNAVVVYDDYVLECSNVDSLNEKGVDIADAFKNVFDRTNK